KVWRRYPAIPEINGGGMGHRIGIRFRDDQPATRPAPHVRNIVMLEQPDGLAERSAAHIVFGQQIGLGTDDFPHRPVHLDDLHLLLLGGRSPKFLGVPAARRRGRPRCPDLVDFADFSLMSPFPYPANTGSSSRS